MHICVYGCDYDPDRNVHVNLAQDLCTWVLFLESRRNLCLTLSPAQAQIWLTEEKKKKKKKPENSTNWAREILQGLVLAVHAADLCSISSTGRKDFWIQKQDQESVLSIAKFGPLSPKCQQLVNTCETVKGVFCVTILFLNNVVVLALNYILDCF